MPQGSFGEIRAFNDFTGSYEDVTWATTSVDLGGGWAMVSENEGTLNQIVDEPGGILEFLTDTADNDNVVLYAGPFKPSDGGVVMECRFKVADDLNFASFAGFAETLAMGTPVMPAEYASAVMTYNGGGTVGLQYDLDGGTDDFRAASGDGSTFSGTLSNGSAVTADSTRANQTITADEWYVCRIEIGPSGRCDYWIAHDGELELVASITGAITTSDLFYAVLMCENRAAAAHNFQVDYVYARGFRDWSAD
jgi:hypothetical protein